MKGFLRGRRFAARLLAVGRAARRDPLGFLRFLLSEAAVFEPDLTGPGIERRVRLALDERLRPFMSAPPAALLPVRALDEICGGPEPATRLPLAEADFAELPAAEQRAISRLALAVRPRTIFEIGTYRGRTTQLLAARSPEATVHTLDLPPEQMLEGGCFHDADPHLIGASFAGKSSVRPRIVQHYGDSRRFDFTPFRKRMDLVFVDASHAYEAVLSDSRHALEMVRPGGVVLWDDYHPVHGPGVMRALAEIGTETPVAWIRGTRLAIHMEPAGSG